MQETSVLIQATLRRGRDFEEPSNDQGTNDQGFAHFWNFQQSFIIDAWSHEIFCEKSNS